MLNNQTVALSSSVAPFLTLPACMLCAEDPRSVNDETIDAAPVLCSGIAIITDFPNKERKYIT